MPTPSLLRTALLTSLLLGLPALADAHGRHGHAHGEGHAHAKTDHDHDHDHEHHHDHDHDGHRSHGAHVHGQSQLDIAVVGGTIEFQLDGAAHNFIGFERAPASAEETARVEAARALLATGDALFALPPQAGCRQQEQRVSAPLPEAKPDGHGHDHGHDHAQSAHANWQAYHRFECARPEALDGLQVRVFEHFPETTRIDYQLVSERAQTGGRLGPGEDRVSLR